MRCLIRCQYSSRADQAPDDSPIELLCVVRGGCFLLYFFLLETDFFFPSLAFEQPFLLFPGHFGREQGSMDYFKAQRLKFLNRIANMLMIKAH